MEDGGNRTSRHTILRVRPIGRIFPAATHKQKKNCNSHCAWKQQMVSGDRVVAIKREIHAHPHNVQNALKRHSTQRIPARLSTQHAALTGGDGNPIKRQIIIP